MNRRGFLGGLAALLALKKIPVEQKVSPGVASTVNVPHAEAIGFTTYGTASNGCSTMTIWTGDDGEEWWLYNGTTSNGNTGVTLTFK